MSKCILNCVYCIHINGRIRLLDISVDSNIKTRITLQCTFLKIKQISEKDEHKLNVKLCSGKDLYHQKGI